MFVKKLLAVCFTALLMTGATLYTFGNFGAAIYHVEMKKVEIERMKALSEVVKSLPPEALIPRPAPSPTKPEMLQLSAPVHATPSPTPADSEVVLNEGEGDADLTQKLNESDGKTVLSDYDGKEVLDGKSVLPFNDKVVLDDTPPVAIDLPRLPPNTFVPHIPPTSP